MKEFDYDQLSEEQFLAMLDLADYIANVQQGEEIPDMDITFKIRDGEVVYVATEETHWLDVQEMHKKGGSNEDGNPKKQ